MTREMQWKEIGKLEDENEGLRVIAENLLHTLVLVQRERDKTRAELAEAKPY